MRSCFYEGMVRHRRMEPCEHAFRFRQFMVYLDLDELPRVLKSRWGWSMRRPALARFDRAEYLGDPTRPLAECVREEVERATGRRPAGPIRLLTHLRYFGYVFNPISLFYCFAPDGETLEAIVAEVHNTPWRERTCYVLGPGGEIRDGRIAAERDKAMHVSPFMPMDMRYAFRLTRPDMGLTVHIENHKEGRRVFDATMTMQRRPITPGSKLRMLARYPLMTFQVIVAIHWQALRLWLKRVPVHAHPNRLADSGERR